MTPQIPHLIAQTGTAPFSGGAATPALKGNKGKRNNGNPGKRQQRPKAAWGNWQTSASPGGFAGAGFQAQTPPTFLGSDREAEYIAEIQQLRTMLAPTPANAFFMQNHAYAVQNASSAVRPRPFYCGVHGWNVSHNGTECRLVAGDSRYTDAMRAATTHEGTGGNPKVGPPVSYVRPSFSFFLPPALSNTCGVCSQDTSAKAPPPPYEDRRARALPASHLRRSEGQNASLVRALACAMPVCPIQSVLPVSSQSCLSAKPSPRP